MDKIEKIKEWVKKQKKEELARNSIGVITGKALFVDANELLSFLNTLSEEPGVDVTDFCKPIDPGIAQCVADHWHEMFGEVDKHPKNVLLPSKECDHGLREPLESEEPDKSLEEAAEEFAEGEWDGVAVDTDGNPLYAQDEIEYAFKAGAEWQYQKDREEFAKIKAKTWCEGFDAHKEQILKGAVEGEIEEVSFNNGEVHNTIRFSFDEESLRVENRIWFPRSGKDGDKVRIVVLKKEE